MVESEGLSRGAMKDLDLPEELYCVRLNFDRATWVPLKVKTVTVPRLLLRHNPC